MSNEETTDIVQYLLPQLNDVGIETSYCKVDTTTPETQRKRGDVWISTSKHDSSEFYENIIALIEAKHKNTNIGDNDWLDAMDQGKLKSQKQNLNFYIITNCLNEFRFYNSYNDEEIYLDNKLITKLVPCNILKKIQTQVSEDNSYVVDKCKTIKSPLTEPKFMQILSKLETIYRSAGIRKGNDRIDPTVSFIILKYISEKEEELRTLNSNIKLWNDLKSIVDEEQDVKIEFNNMKDLIWGEDSEYSDNIYKDFKDLIIFNTKLKNSHYIKIYNEIDKIDSLHGSDFDLFGAIYEKYADQGKKKKFGEFYTRRHITKLISNLLLINEKNPRDLLICDPACGTGGFLTEGYKTLWNNYDENNKLTDDVKKELSENIFWGYDNDEKSVARTKINMFLAGDGHTNIYEIADSLCEWEGNDGWLNDTFDYIMTNPPFGTYEGRANIDNFDITNEKKLSALFLEKVIKATKESGEIGIIMEDGVLENPTYSTIRRKLLEYCDIKAIISLTKFAFAPYTKEKTYILFLQKKLKQNFKEIQKFPIWHYILDYDGFHNSDKRFKTKYHNDLPEIEELFKGATELSKHYENDLDYFNHNKCKFERKVNEREKTEGLSGDKSRYVYIEDILSNNYNLLSEFYLRNYEIKTMPLNDVKKELNSIKSDLEELLNDL